MAFLSAIVAWALRNRPVVLVASLLLVALGLRAATKLSVDAVPDITNVQVQVITAAPALSPVEVEQYVTVPVERALAEFRSGRPVLISSTSEVTTAMPIDGMTETMLAGFRLLSAPVRPFLLITARRAHAMCINTSGPIGIALSDLCTANEILSLASATRVGWQV